MQGIVEFVGVSGAGKSTLIRALRKKKYISLDDIKREYRFKWFSVFAALKKSEVLNKLVTKSKKNDNLYIARKYSSLIELMIICVSKSKSKNPLDIYVLLRQLGWLNELMFACTQYEDANKKTLLVDEGFLTRLNFISRFSNYDMGLLLKEIPKQDIPSVVVYCKIDPNENLKRLNCRKKIAISHAEKRLNLDDRLQENLAVEEMLSKVKRAFPKIKFVELDMALPLCDNINYLVDCFSDQVKNK